MSDIHCTFLSGRAMEWYVGQDWELPQKGLSKHVLNLKFSKLDKPHFISKVCLVAHNVENLEERPSKYLASERIGQEQLLELGTAVTPVDCYIEILVQQMFVGEKALCKIRTLRGRGGQISFVLTLQKLFDTIKVHDLKLSEMCAESLRFKKNGVKMYKEYPVFAQEYFGRAAKCLMSFLPSDNLKDTGGEVTTDYKEKFIQVQTNLAACLLNQSRFEDVLYQTRFVDVTNPSSEKSIYRRAVAYFHMKEFEAAQKLIERVPNYFAKKDFKHLHQRVLESWKETNNQYKSMVQRMFS